MNYVDRVSDNEDGGLNINSKTVSHDDKGNEIMHRNHANNTSH